MLRQAPDASLGILVRVVRVPRRPAPLLEVAPARLLGLALLALLGAVEWRRMLEGAQPPRTVLWVLLAVAGALAALGVGRLRPGRPRALAALGLAPAFLLLVGIAAGVPRALLAPRGWDELAPGVVRGAETLAAVTLPYAGAEPWPPLALELGGAALCALAGLLALWPRPGAAPGLPFLSLGVLLVLVVTPTVALGTAHEVAVGVLLAALAVLFLWLERLPLRPGAGVALLAGIALAGALPLGSVADRDDPWWDYRAFAADLGSVASLRFTWDQEYAALTWPREGREILRVRSRAPHYWKAANLEDFDGLRWAQRGVPHPGGFDPSADLPADWASRGEWNGEAQVAVRGLRDTAFVGPATSLEVAEAPTRVLASFSPGRLTAARELRPGDSYRIRFHAPRPSPGRLATASSGQGGEQADALVLTVPIPPRRAAAPTPPPAGALRRRARRVDRPATSAEVAFAPFAHRRPPAARYARSGRTGSGERVLARSPYARTWRLAQRLKRGAPTPYELVRRIDAHLERGFRYAEAPPPVPEGRAPLDAFLADTRAGFCQHFSGAMALLLRMGGVPARVASGFSPGGRRGRDEEWVVRDRDAHAWVEAWFDGLGWVTFDPTPPAAPARQRLAELDARGEQSATFAAPGAKPTPAGRNPAGTRRDLDAPASAPGSAPAVVQEPEAASRVGLLLLVVLALPAVALLLARRWRRRARGPAGEDREIAELLTALSRTGREVPARATLRELEARLGGSPYVRALAAARYGPRPVPLDAAARRAFRRELSAGLGLAGRLRALWAVPPRRGAG